MTSAVRFKSLARRRNKGLVLSGNTLMFRSCLLLVLLVCFFSHAATTRAQTPTRPARDQPPASLDGVVTLLKEKTDVVMVPRRAFTGRNASPAALPAWHGAM